MRVRIHGERSSPLEFRPRSSFWNFLVDESVSPRGRPSPLGLGREWVFTENVPHRSVFRPMSSFWNFLVDESVSPRGRPSSLSLGREWEFTENEFVLELPSGRECHSSGTSITARFRTRVRVHGERRLIFRPRSSFWNFLVDESVSPWGRPSPLGLGWADRHDDAETVSLSGSLQFQWDAAQPHGGRQNISDSR
ncbi:hypothetical protein LR48_Vigan09g050300 [Vigna angularis]|uniref:Uncharacterized protein n=1 Tax=Phaseolus angularis TaxID=3914 RepID=A0A0L9VB13_PHAAN|nr:hypothetical protein LR48_Vigan09g050300 [Vigna angularis]